MSTPVEYEALKDCLGDVQAKAEMFRKALEDIHRTERWGVPANLVGDDHGDYMLAVVRWADLQEILTKVGIPMDVSGPRQDGTNDTRSTR